MTTAGHYKANHILMWTIKSIKRTKSEDNTEGPYQFEIQCNTASYSHNSKIICARHPHFFKESYYSFCPINKIILSMPFEFINKLKFDEWTKIDPIWLKKLHEHLKNADKNAIKQVQFIRQIYMLVPVLEKSPF